MIKKALSIFFTCTALYTCAVAQEKSDDTRSSKFYYYTKSWQPITLKDSAYVTRAITPDPADSKLFIVEDT
ncbi:MAG: hypothetical protein ACXVB0_14895 [Mucilaginibacter sp.]